MSKPFKTLSDDLASKVGEDLLMQARAEARAEHEKGARRLREIREAQNKTQQEIAAGMNVSQSMVGQLERRADQSAAVYVTTLQRYLGAMDVELEIAARFPDGEVLPIAIGDIDDRVA